MVLSLVALTVVSILAVGVYSVTRAMVRESVYQLRLAQAQALAEAGMENALLQLRLTPGWRAGYTDKAFGGGSYTVTFSTTTSLWITSRGASGSLPLLGTTRSSVSALAQITRPCTTLSNRDATLDGFIDSYDSSVSTSPASFGFGGHFCSNDGVSVLSRSSPSLHMDVDYFGSPAPAASTVEGTIARSTYTTALPAHDGSAYASANDNGKLPGAYYTAGSKRLAIPSNVAVTITSGTYYLNTLTVNGNLRVDPSLGPVTLYMNGNLTLSNRSGTGNGEITNLSGVPSNLAIYPQGNRTLTLGSKGALHAVIEGDATTVNVSQTIYGNIKASRLTINSPYTLHFDHRTALDALPTRVAWQMNSWSSSP